MKVNIEINTENKNEQMSLIYAVLRSQIFVTNSSVSFDKKILFGEFKLPQLIVENAVNMEMGECKRIEDETTLMFLFPKDKNNLSKGEQGKLMGTLASFCYNLL